MRSLCEGSFSQSTTDCLRPSDPRSLDGKMQRGLLLAPVFLTLVENSHHIMKLLFTIITYHTQSLQENVQASLLYSVYLPSYHPSPVPKREKKQRKKSINERQPGYQFVRDHRLLSTRRTRYCHQTPQPNPKRKRKSDALRKECPTRHHGHVGHVGGLL